MNGEENGQTSAGYTCPKCGKPAEVSYENGTSIICPDCGGTKILLSFLSNGDMETRVEGTGEYYEMDLTVRKAQKELDDLKAKGCRYVDLIGARNRLAAAYADSGREGKGETLANETLAEAKEMYKSASRYAENYCDQASLCAMYANNRGDRKTAVQVYDSVLKDLEGVRDINTAILMVKRAVLWNKFDLEICEKYVKDAMDIIGDSDVDSCPDPYVKVIAYDTLRAIAMQKNQPELIDGYVDKALDERLRLYRRDPEGTPDYKLLELVDAMGYKAELLTKFSDSEEAARILDEAVDISKGHPEANSFAVMNRARYIQSQKKEIPDNFKEEMDGIIDTLEATVCNKRMKEVLAQAYMFRSMVRDPEDYDSLVYDIGHAYDTLMEIAYEGNVNEMFLMSAARSYLVLLNMKDHEKAKRVRAQLQEIGISQMKLDQSSRTTMGNAGKKTRVTVKPAEQPQKPLPGRRLKRTSKHR